MEGSLFQQRSVLLMPRLPAPNSNSATRSASTATTTAESFHPCVKVRIPKKQFPQMNLNMNGFNGPSYANPTAKNECGFCERPTSTVACTTPNCGYVMNKTARLKRACPNQEHAKKLQLMDLSAPCPKCRIPGTLRELNKGPFRILFKNANGLIRYQEYVDEPVVIPPVLVQPPEKKSEVENLPQLTPAKIFCNMVKGFEDLTVNPSNRSDKLPGTDQIKETEAKKELNKDCICLRKVDYLLCSLCGSYLNKGRIKKICDVHPLRVFGRDVNQCLKEGCQAEQKWLVEKILQRP